MVWFLVFKETEKNIIIVNNKKFFHLVNEGLIIIIRPSLNSITSCNRSNKDFSWKNNYNHQIY